VKYVNLGRTGLQVSRICLGMMSYGDPRWQPWVLPGDAGEAFVRRALEAGINFFDTADFYSYGASEEVLGRAVARLTRREEVAIATKVGLPMGQGVNASGLSRKHIRESLHASLRRLKSDYVDVYLLHQPDPRTPLEESLDALGELRREGKVLYTGASNYPGWLLASAVYDSRHRTRSELSVTQVQYNLCYRENERDTLPLAMREGLGVMVYSPLARGYLAGNRTRDAASQTPAEATRAATDAKALAQYGSEVDRAVLEAVERVARAKGVPPGRVAMAWLLSRPSVSSIICGVLDDRHLDEAIQAVEVELTADEIAALEAPYRAQEVKDTGLGAVLSVGRGES
jgi:aryl-alcohol dehydrogenase-like predicted oxidoreductase